MGGVGCVAYRLQWQEAGPAICMPFWRVLWSSFQGWAPSTCGQHYLVGMGKWVRPLHAHGPGSSTEWRRV